MKTSTLQWQETLNDITIDCSLEIAVHQAKKKAILLVIPGVDGSLDGFQDKYLKIATKANLKNIPVVRMENPFITSYHWESNIRRVLEYIEDNATLICGSEDFELRIMAHSAGASIVSHIAWEYPYISKLLLVNPATKLNLVKTRKGLKEFNKPVTLLLGSNDPSVELVGAFDSNNNLQIEIIENADHNFSGTEFKLFLESPETYLLID